MDKQKNLPIIVGVGQVVNHWDGTDQSQAPSPIGLITDSISKAQADAGIDPLHHEIDRLVVVRAFTDSLRNGVQRAFRPLPRQCTWAP